MAKAKKKAKAKVAKAVRTLTKTPVKAKKLPKPVKAREAFYRNVGYGLVSWEGPDKVIAVRGGKLFTETFDNGMDPSGQKDEWVFDGGFGMKTYATLVKPEGFDPSL